MMSGLSIKDIKQQAIENNSDYSRIILYYDRYMQSGNIEDANMFIKYISRYCTGEVCRILISKGCYSKENIEDIIQEGSISSWKNLKEDYDEKTQVNHVIALYRTIYRTKALDFVRKKVSEQVKYKPVSIEKNDESEWKTDILPPDKSIDDIYDEKECREVIMNIITMYCEALVADYKIPQRNLALFYSKILYHLECGEGSYLSSPKWAITRMGQMKVCELKDESNQVFTKEIRKGLCWSENYINAIGSVCAETGLEIPFNNVIYTSAFSKERIENLSENMHNVLVKNVAKRLKENRVESERCIEYVRNMSAFRKFFS